MNPVSESFWNTGANVNDWHHDRGWMGYEVFGGLSDDQKATSFSRQTRPPG